MHSDSLWYLEASGHMAGGLTYGVTASKPMPSTAGQQQCCKSLCMIRQAIDYMFARWLTMLMYAFGRLIILI